MSLRSAPPLKAEFEFTYLAPPPPEITYVSATRISAFGGEALVVNLKNMVPVPVTVQGSFSSDVTALFGFVKGTLSPSHPRTLSPSHPL